MVVANGYLKESGEGINPVFTNSHEKQAIASDGGNRKNSTDWAFSALSPLKRRIAFSAFAGFQHGAYKEMVGDLPLSALFLPTAMAGNDSFDFGSFFSGSPYPDGAKPLPGITDEELLRRVSMRPSRDQLYAISQYCVERRAQLMDISILTARSAAQVVVALIGDEEVGSYHGVPIPLYCKNRPRAWVEERVFEALEDLILEDTHAYRSGLEQVVQEEPRHLYLEPWFQIPKTQVLGAAVRFNHCSEPIRQAFYKVFIKRESLEGELPRHLGTPERVRTLAEKGLRAIVDPPPPEFLSALEDPNLS